MKGVADDDARAAVETIDDDSERARALALVSAKLASTARFEPQVRRRRLVSMLQRRGYRQGVALSVVDEALGDLLAQESLPPDD
jgi:regulatory protein